MCLRGRIVALEQMSGAEWSLGGDDRGDAVPPKSTLYRALSTLLVAGLASLLDHAPSHAILLRE